MYYKEEENRGNPKIWLNLDPLTVKQRIARIAEQLDEVRRKFEPAVDLNNSFGQKKN
ncbi:MAG: hypothetical protein ICV63_15715 [Coleofasciculus sp. Co-bin14]|nr:hypothetical protein [Coleofasciculus sp. Co-bin14]